MRHKLCAIARVIKTHGKMGEVVCVATDGLPFLIEENMTIYPVPPALKGARSYVVTDVEKDARGGLVRLSGINSISHADTLVGKTLLVKRDALPASFDYFSPESLIGMEVTDERAGYLGHIVEVLSGPTQDVWVLERENERLLVPILDDVLVGLIDTHTLSIHAKAGSIMIEA